MWFRRRGFKSKKEGSKEKKKSNVESPWQRLKLKGMQNVGAALCCVQWRGCKI
jgi:hypothetical protein